MWKTLSTFVEHCCRKYSKSGHQHQNLVQPRRPHSREPTCHSGALHHVSAVSVFLCSSRHHQSYANGILISGCLLTCTHCPSRIWPGMSRTCTYTSVSLFPHTLISLFLHTPSHSFTRSPSSRWACGTCHWAGTTGTAPSGTSCPAPSHTSQR